ncbi:hypothetical protein [Pseudonocardia sp.]|uniref:hypothetical protein n=1 Tax=Pseudonocardia sp. TaxID=60912 RepID=UPI003D136F8A
MAREHARILCSIWRPGDDFRDRSPEAQRLYFLIVSQRELNNAGVIPLMVSKWARCSAGTTVDDVEDALAELEQSRYVVVDRETDEVLVRTFIRNDGVAKQPNILKSALRIARQIESQTIRDALARELTRIPSRDAFDTAVEIAPAVVQRHTDNPSGKGSADPSVDLSANPSHGPAANPSRGPETNPSPSPAGRGGGRGRGKGSSSVGGSVGGTRERATTPPAEPNLDPNNPRCADHAAIPATERGPDCRACQAVRREVQEHVADDVLAETARRAAWRAEVDACDECDENGKRQLDDGSLTTHHPHPSARREAS